jgi:uncharacterized protein YycO
MKTIFCRRHTVGSIVLRAALWSSWSHCGIVLPDDTVVEARAFEGVVHRPVADLIAESSKFEYRDIAVPHDAAAYEFALAQVGKRYDRWGVVGLGVRREWEEPDAWFCSELVEAAAVAGGRRRFLHQARRVTPQHSWMVA